VSLSPGGPDLASLSSLDDPLRRRLYEVVTSHPGPVSRDEAASEAGIGRALAVYHLDKLVESGLLTASYQRPPGRRGPGAGRPAKVYARSDREFAVTVPPREYELAEAARRLGTELGSAFRPSPADRDVKGVLTQQGYEPCGGADGVIRLRNCPFHQLTEQHREVVCGMNLALVEGLVEGLGAGCLRPVLDPQPGHCCVAIGGVRS
jgi:predicted ArsR family transcriptional regulator